MGKTKTPAETAEAALSHQSPLETKPQPGDYLNIGVTPMNLAIAGFTDRSIRKGHVYRFNGRPSGGKTFLGRTVLAEAANSPAFDDYELVYDDIEHGALMDTEKFFGKKLVERLRAPAYKAKSRRPHYSQSAKELFDRIRKRLLEGRKMIWIADSLDALEGEGKNPMTDNKAKIYSQEMRKLMDPLEATGSILIVMSQSRVNIGGGPFEEEDITAGGRALEHYPSVDIQLRKYRTIYKPHNGVKYAVGSVIRAKIKKNRVAGGEPTIFFPFYRKYGIDDLGACVNYLIAVRHWKGPKKRGEEELEVHADEGDDVDKENKLLVAEEFNFEGPKADLIHLIEENSQQRELQVLVGRVWKDIEKAITPERKPRYV